MGGIIHARVMHTHFPVLYVITKFGVGGRFDHAVGYTLVGVDFVAVQVGPT